MRLGYCAGRSRQKGDSRNSSLHRQRPSENRTPVRKVYLQVLDSEGLILPPGPNRSETFGKWRQALHGFLRVARGAARLGKMPRGCDCSF
jgi:hypothetical protein